MNSRLKRRVRNGAAFVLAVTAAAAALTGCSGSGSASGNTSSTPVTVWSWRSQDAPLWKTVEQDTGVKINFRSVTATSYDSVLQTAMNGGSGPDIFYSRAGSGTMTYGAASLAAPLDKVVSFNGINKTSLDAAQYQGKTYGVPFAIQTMEMFYNTDLLKKSGLSAPTTWNDLISDLKKLKSDGVTPMGVMGTQQWLLALQLYAIEASTADNNWNQSLVNKKAALTDKPFVQSLAAFQQLEPYFENNWQAVGSAGNEQETNFALGKTAFIIDGIFNTATINQVGKGLNYSQSLVPSPNGQKPKIEWYVDGNISMNAKISNAAESAAAKKVMAFTSSKKFGDAFASIAGEISPIAGVTIPSKYKLSAQAYKWYQTAPVSPVIGIRSPLDTPPVDPSSLKTKSKAVNTNKGIFTAQMTDIVDLLSGKLSAQQEAGKLQSDLSWYFAK